MTADWLDYLSSNDREVLSRGKWAQRAGFGQRPALIIVDAQDIYDRIEGAPDNKENFPLACGEAGFAAVRQIARLQQAARASGIPVFQTRFIVNPMSTIAACSTARSAPELPRAKTSTSTAPSAPRSWTASSRCPTRSSSTRK